jgi:DNA-binding transcriptional LysR family regulator
VRRLLTELDDCELNLVEANDTPTGRLKINLPVSYGRRYVMPLLARFHQAYPGIELDLSFNDAYVDMIEQGVDVCIRSGSLEASSLIARQLSPIDFLICASPAYLDNHGPLIASEFSRHHWIRFRFRQTGRLMPIMVPGIEEQQNLDPGQQFIVDDGEALAELCAQGLGLTQMPHFIARDWLRKKQMVPVMPYYRPKQFGVWVIYAKRAFLPAKIRVFVAFLSQALEQQQETAYRTWAEELSY